MDTNVRNIIEAIDQDKELVRMLPLMKDVAIVEYDGSHIDCCWAFFDYMEREDIDVSCVSRIILLGKKSASFSYNENTLYELFPSADVSIPNKRWDELDLEQLQICNCLVIHNGVNIEVSDYHQERKSQFLKMVDAGRIVYSVAFLINREIMSLFDTPYYTSSVLRLTDKEKASSKPKEQTQFCKEKQDYINSCLKNITPRDAFEQCLDEYEHGCEDCNMCTNYDTRKHCPYAQRNIAKFYREGRYVPQDDRIAHQWEVMAARQGFASAKIQVADDYKDGKGCEQNFNKALKIYNYYADNDDNEYCVNQLLSLCDEDATINKIVAVPYMAKLARNGNDDMVIKVADAFHNGDYNLPQDIVQQREWIEKGAENGNPRFVKAMAEMYESVEDWSQTYKWYKKLYEIDSCSVDESTLDEVELKMITNNSSPSKIADAGEKYLYGYFGTERDLHLAYRCLEYSANKGVAKAKRLLGFMYSDGLYVDKDEEEGIRLLKEAAIGNDIISIDHLYDLYTDGYITDEEPLGNDMFVLIEEGEVNEDSDALFIKAKYVSIGYLYNQDVYEAFEYMKMAAERDMPIAQYELAKMYKRGIGTMTDQEQYIIWLKKAADNGCNLAEGEYGMYLYEKRILRPFWRTKAFPYLKHAYEKGNIDTRWCLAQCYLYGYGTDKDKRLAYQMCTEEAENGNSDAQTILCEKYFSGDDCYLSKNYTLCAKWGELAISQGIKGIRFETAYSSSHIGKHERAKELYLELANEGNSAAMNNYACELSDAVEKTKWFQKAAEEGEDYGMWNLAKRYRDGAGIEKDIDKAMEWFSKAAENGHSGAMEDLAYMYQHGEGIETDGAKAIEWYKKAINKGEEDCILKVADIYRQGNVVPQDMEQAIHYYRMAAEKGNSVALFRLGQINEDGIGVESNIHKAIYWYRKSAIKNNTNAQECLTRLNVNWLKEDGSVISSVPEEENDSL